MPDQAPEEGPVRGYPACRSACAPFGPAAAKAQTAAFPPRCPARGPHFLPERKVIYSRSRNLGLSS